MGILYSTSIVASLRNREAIRPLAFLLFVCLAGLWSALTPLMGLFVGSVVWYPIWTLLAPSPNNIIFLSMTGSAIGSAVCWLFIRWFWMKSLRHQDLFRTVVLCVAATVLASTLALPLIPSEFRDNVDIIDLVVTVSWWFAFSISLYWSETTQLHRQLAAANG